MVYLKKTDWGWSDEDELRCDSACRPQVHEK